MRDIFVAASVQHFTECTVANRHIAQRFRPNAQPHLLQVSVSECSFTCESHKDIKRKRCVCLCSFNLSSRESSVKWPVSHSCRFELGTNRRLCGAQGQSGEQANPSSLTRIERRTVQPVAQPLCQKYQKRFSLIYAYGSNHPNTINEFPVRD